MSSIITNTIEHNNNNNNDKPWLSWQKNYLIAPLKM